MIPAAVRAGSQSPPGNSVGSHRQRSCFGSRLWHPGIDFATDWTLRQTIVSNLPSDKRSPTLRDRLALHALEVAEKVALIVPVTWQCGQWRRDNLFKLYPPRLILT
jgi:hypothetical protein